MKVFYSTIKSSMFFLILYFFTYTQVLCFDNKFINNFFFKVSSKDVVFIKAQKNFYKVKIKLYKDIVFYSTQKAKLTSENGSIVLMYFPYIIIKGIFFYNSGKNINLRDSCLFLNRFSNFSYISLNKFVQCGFGVWLHNTSYNVLKKNFFIGVFLGLVSIRGNNIQIFNTKGTYVTHNYIQYGRDGIYITTSKEVVIKKNILFNTRYGIHYMYSNACSLIANRNTNSSVGFAIMFSKFVCILNNFVTGNKEHGILLRDIFYSTIYFNKSFKNYEGIFFGSSYYNKLKNNFIFKNFIAVKVSNGSNTNKIWKNNFVDNRIQFQLIDTRLFLWSSEKIGNYWSHYNSFHFRNFDVYYLLIGKKFYASFISDWLLSIYPHMRLIFNSPILILLQRIENTFPSLRDSAVLDYYPLLFLW